MYVHYGPFAKKIASYVPWFNFDGIFFDKKSGFQMANFLFFLNFAKNGVFFKALRAIFSEVDSCAFSF